MTKHFASVFFRREEINIPTWEDGFVFKVGTFQILCVPDRCHKPAQRCDRPELSVITLVVNISTSNYNWKGLNESAFPAHLYLS